MKPRPGGPGFQFPECPGFNEEAEYAQANSLANGDHGRLLWILAAGIGVGCSKKRFSKGTPVVYLRCRISPSTPDGMAIAPDGDLVVACPNFASYPPGATTPPFPAAFKIGKRPQGPQLVRLPRPGRDRQGLPHGIEFGPQGELYVVDNQNWATGNGANGEINQGRILRLRLNGDQLVESIVVAKGISHPNGCGIATASFT